MSTDEKELLRRMAEPEFLRKLRQQKEQIEQERRRAQKQRAWELEADQVRRAIIQMGHKPVC